MGAFRYCLMKHDFYSSHIPRAVGMYDTLDSVQRAFESIALQECGNKSDILSFEIEIDEHEKTIHWIHGEYSKYTTFKYYIQGVWCESGLTTPDHMNTTIIDNYYSFGSGTCPNCNMEDPFGGNYCQQCCGSRAVGGSIRDYANKVSKATSKLRQDFHRVDFDIQQIRREIQITNGMLEMQRQRLDKL